MQKCFFHISEIRVEGKCKILIINLIREMLHIMALLYCYYCHDIVIYLEKRKNVEISHRNIIFIIYVIIVPSNFFIYTTFICSMNLDLIWVVYWVMGTPLSLHLVRTYYHKRYSSSCSFNKIIYFSFFLQIKINIQLFTTLHTTIDQ